MDPWLPGALLAAGVWLYLCWGRGRFWRPGPFLAAPSGRRRWPAVAAVCPARNEAAMLARTLPALRAQDYPGDLRVILVDDCSEDGTAGRAAALARSAGAPLEVLSGSPPPAGWTGKLWAMEQGAQAAAGAPFIWFTDADIVHPPDSLRTLVDRALGEDLDLVSLMARLRADTVWERLTIPAFVYFFAMLYPFRWVASPHRPTAAAAGGCLLLRREALERAGGLAAISGALIDDCALARRIKDSGGRLWLGMGTGVRSLRRYGGLAEVWRTVARTAFVQLRHSYRLLAACLLAMALVFCVPPAALVAASAGGGSVPAGAAGLCAWAVMAATYLPMVRFYGLAPGYALLLPFTALLYAGMTADSAWRFARARGGQWKGRRHPASLGDRSLRPPAKRPGETSMSSMPCAGRPPDVPAPRGGPEVPLADSGASPSRPVGAPCPASCRSRSS